MIAGTQHSFIRLTWDSFAVESHSSCNYDSVTVYDGNRLDVPLDSPDNTSTAIKIDRYINKTSITLKIIKPLQIFCHVKLFTEM